MTDLQEHPGANPEPAAPPARAAATPDPTTERLESVGSFVQFVGQVLKDIPTAVRLYPAEIMHHCGAQIRQNFLVAVFMLFMMGAVMGLTANFLYSSIGIDSLIASVNSVAGLRGMCQVVFGWIIAAKLGCGIVAELGAMRISEEIDALEVMGVRSVPYLASTRVIAAAITMPLLFVVGLLVNFGAGWLFNVELLNTVSSGGFEYFLFLFQNVRDFTIAIVWALLLGLMIVVVACYFGYTASGGPVGVGRATAQSMLVNLVLVSIVGMVLVQLFYGNSPNAPIGN
ncbi:MlaE family ABC transporter permease [Nocardioides daeguensis]|uniref:ABC transporter permease n=1 Tax=Nocardioides daeguensis TaxID=908359 RepID=A0ABP6V892_9ACTN|nr:ABC transporter permease [Nocardioides daeguensis]MBV6726511.1 ABC transporter permease [Nocardioides daeguensis]MCR1772354.1 ABC transporter permease [Nocardioides daeguensis]